MMRLPNLLIKRFASSSSASSRARVLASCTTGNMATTQYRWHGSTGTGAGSASGGSGGNGGGRPLHAPGGTASLAAATAALLGGAAAVCEHPDAGDAAYSGTSSFFPFSLSTPVTHAQCKNCLHKDSDDEEDSDVIDDKRDVEDRPEEEESGKSVQVQATSSSSGEERDEDDNLPSYIPEMFRDHLDNALNHKQTLAIGSRVGLATESQYPIEKANMTFAPDVPPPIKRQHPVHLVVDMVCINKRMNVIGNTKYEYWPFGFYDERERKYKVGVPGPFIRARVGDVLQLNFTNKDQSGMAHSVDFHAVVGPGGASPTNFAEQDETKTGSYLLSRPGLYVYHCAAAPIPVHVNNGMFGLILVEPAEGLPPVDREFYVMQHELYVTEDEDSDDGDYETDYDGAYKEIPKHVLFNGREGALVERPIMVKQDEKVRVFFGNAGPNLVSSFHIIGLIFDRVYREGDLVSPPAKYVQTTLVPAGGAVMVEMDCMQVPGTYAIVDHSIFRIDKGAVGTIKVKGKPRPEIYDSMEPPIYCPGCKTHQ